MGGPRRYHAHRVEKQKMKKEMKGRAQSGP